MTVYTLSIDGAEMPTPKQEGVTLTDEKVWSANTGRTTSGKMVGDIVAIKTTVKIEWNRLTGAQATQVRKAVSNRDKPFSELSFTDLDGNTTTMTVYFGTPTFTEFSATSGGSVSNVSVSGIEQ